MRTVSPVRFFDAPMLELARWVADRYVTPLATVLGALSPPRVAEEDAAGHTASAHTAAAHMVPVGPSPSMLRSYWGGSALLAAVRGGDGAWIVRPAPEDEADLAIELVAAAVAGGRRAIVLVPEADPVPFTATAIRAAFGERAGLFLGGSKRERYRRWLEIARGRFDVVVGGVRTRR
jgi:primosomal protein N' (replication factor Y)